MRASALLLRLSFLSWAAVWCMSSVACGDDDGPPAPEDDGGPDDAGSSPDAGNDAGGDPEPVCESECLGIEVCCPEAPGSEVGACVDLRNDLDHCGGCGETCGDTFTSCVNGRCICGTTPCIAPRVCCPLTDDPDGRVCRNLANDLRSCGSCDRACDEDLASRCVDGECVCGAEGRACDRAAGETCCRDGDLRGGARCAVLATDDDFCGACRKPDGAHTCGPGSSCIDGLCTLGEPTCDEGCGLSAQVCCLGMCCRPRQCTSEGCVFDG